MEKVPLNVVSLAHEVAGLNERVAALEQQVELLWGTLTSLGRVRLEGFDDALRLESIRQGVKPRRV